MFLDVLLPVASAVLTIFTGYLGFHVTFHPAETPRAKRLYKLSFFLCSLITIILIGVQALRNARTQSTLEATLGRIEKNTIEPPKVSITNTIPPTQVVITPSPFDSSGPIERQGQLQDPNLIVEPERIVRSNPPGIFSLNIHNVGLSDVDSVESYFDLFWLSNINPIKMQKLGAFIDAPD